MTYVFVFDIVRILEIVIWDVDSWDPLDLLLSTVHFSSQLFHIIAIPILIYTFVLIVKENIIKAKYPIYFLFLLGLFLYAIYPILPLFFEPDFYCLFFLLAGIILHVTSLILVVTSREKHEIGQI
ncbi:MAG: hypothetical protein ACFFDN_23390 [Candidatus Hodarchaeota archaeon]